MCLDKRRYHTCCTATPPQGIAAFTANKTEKSAVLLACVLRGTAECSMQKNKAPALAAEARFPTTRRALGDNDFARLCADSKNRSLPDTLRKDPAWAPVMRKMPWLADVAAMEQMAHAAIADAPLPALDPAGLEDAAREPMQLSLHLQPHVKLLRSEWDIPAIWQGLANGNLPQNLRAADSFTVIYNSGGNAAVWSVSEAAYILLENLQSSPNFALAAAAALRTDNSFALDRFLAMLVQQQLLVQK